MRIPAVGQIWLAAIIISKAELRQPVRATGPGILLALAVDELALLARFQFPSVQPETVIPMEPELVKFVPKLLTLLEMLAMASNL